MTWLDAPGFERRPVVFVEDHLYHTTGMLSAVAARRPDLLSHITVCAIDRGGPDTAATVRDWLREYPDLQIVAAVEDRLRESISAPGVDFLAPADIADATSFARLIARLLRPAGILVQDVQLSTLPFLPADRWWESIYLAATVRGLFAERPPAVRFLSNKRGYSATFGRDLADAGFDPRDVMDKSDLTSSVVPAVAALVDRAFPLALDALAPATGRRRWLIADHESERRDVDRALDLILWERSDDLELGGRLLGDGHTDARTRLRPQRHEARTWQALIEDRLAGGDGLAVAAVGARIGPPDAERAELSNLAARHIHTLRSRLTDPAAIVTADHAYRLGDRVSAGRVTRATSGHLP
jgi:hypothetical protein